MNTVNVNYMTKTYDSFQRKSNSAKSAKETSNFGQKVADGVNEVKDASETGCVKTVEEMSLEEYKDYIRTEISKLPISPSQMNSSFSVHISDAGFEAMKNDPEYEKWVLETLRYDFSFNDPWSNLCGGAYVVHNFGASKEEYTGQGWYKGYNNGNGENLFNQKAKNSTWERRAEKKKESDKFYEKQQAKKRLAQEAYEKYRLKQGMIHSRNLQEAYQDFLEGENGKAQAAGSSLAQLQAATAYETQGLQFGL